MPSSKKNEFYYVNDTDTVEDTFSVDLDDEGNPFIVPDLYNLEADVETARWVDIVHDDIVLMFKNIIEYRDNCSAGPLLEKLTFNRFLIFVSQNSFHKL